MIAAIAKFFKNLFTRKCRGCKEPLKMRTEWEKKYKLYCADCGFYS